MCDICWLKCEVCEETVEMHLGDFATGHEEVAVFCGTHLAEAASHPAGGNRTEFTWVDEKAGEKRMALVPLTANALDQWEENHPNVWVDWHYVHHSGDKISTGTQ